MSTPKNPKDQNFLQRTLNSIGHIKTGKACGTTRQNVKHWVIKGRLPDTEYLPTGHPRRTNYTAAICKLAKCKRSDIL